MYVISRRRRRKPNEPPARRGEEGGWLCGEAAGVLLASLPAARARQRELLRRIFRIAASGFQPSPAPLPFFHPPPPTPTPPFLFLLSD